MKGRHFNTINNCFDYIGRSGERGGSERDCRIGAGREVRALLARDGGCRHRCGASEFVRALCQ